MVATISLYDRSSANQRNSFILLAGFIILVSLLGASIGLLWTGSPIVGLIITIPIVLIIAFFTYQQSENMVLWVSQAKPADREKDRVLIHLVEGLAIAAGIPAPKVYLIDDTALNAFAAGKDPQHSVIVVTKGLYQKLTKLELEGVIAHEMSHIKNYDIRFMTWVVILVGLTTLLADLFWRSLILGGSRNSDSKMPLPVYIFAILLVVLSPIIAVLIQMAVSRQREFLADADGALLTRYPEGLASALEKISQDKEPLEAANTATAHLYISNPLKGNPSLLSGLFNTHPPVTQRIAALRNMNVTEVEKQLQTRMAK